MICSIAAVVLLAARILVVSPQAGRGASLYGGRFLPGGDLPAGTMCRQEYAEPDRLSCRAQSSPQGEVDIYFSYDLKEQVIDHTSVSLPGDGIAVGDLVLAWGDPTGMRQYSSDRQVFWGRRSVYLGGPIYSPFSPVTFVSYDLREPEDVQPWKGFRNG